jgi:hypothetical protein
MPVKLDELLPTATEIQKQAALQEAEKAEQYARRAAAADAEKRNLIEKLSKPSGLTEDEKVKLASTVIQRAVRNGLTEVQVYRFPHMLCTDNGRAINQQEPGWEKTLTGIAQEIYQLWSGYLKPRGYRIRYQIIDFPGGVPGDISIVIAWGSDYRHPASGARRAASTQTHLRTHHGVVTPPMADSYTAFGCWLQDDTVGILQLHTAGSGRKSATGADHGV